MNVNRIDKLIARYIMEICIVTFFIVLSYTGITSNNLKESSAIAQFNRDGSYEMQYEFGRNIDDVLAFKNLLDRGVLTVRNPNRDTKEINIILVIYGDTDNLTGFDIEFGGEKVDLSYLDKSNEMNKILLSKTTIKGYEKSSNTLSIYGNPNAGSTFVYDFEIKESFLS